MSLVSRAIALPIIFYIGWRRKRQGLIDWSKVKYSTLNGRKNTHLPSFCHPGHELCFKLHDIMVQMLKTGEANKLFTTHFNFVDEADRASFESADDIFEWLDRTGRKEERVKIITTTIFPAAISDFLLCIYEALENSRKGKITQSFMLLRKPCQETLYLFECIFLDRAAFTQKLEFDPGSLYVGSAGGPEAHFKRIDETIAKLQLNDFFDSSYLAKIRFDKSSPDGFAGLFDKAIHLFTTHKSIKTESLNINFIFSGIDSKITQWAYLYSRLPYILIYAHKIVEALCAEIWQTPSFYLEDMDRRINAWVLLWGKTINDDYMSPELQKFISATERSLLMHCKAHGFRSPNELDLLRMAETGAFPGESRGSVRKRARAFEAGAATA